MIVVLFDVGELTSQGHGTMAWGFLALYVGPLLTVGVYRLAHKPLEPA